MELSLWSHRGFIKDNKLFWEITSVKYLMSRVHQIHPNHNGLFVFVIVDFYYYYHYCHNVKYCNVFDAHFFFSGKWSWRSWYWHKSRIEEGHLWCINWCRSKFQCFLKYVFISVCQNKIQNKHFCNLVVFVDNMF